MTDEISVHYEIIGRAVVRDKSDLERHSLRLLYRGDGTPWWTCSAGLDLPIPASFGAQPGEVITLTVTRNDPR